MKNAHLSRLLRPEFVFTYSLPLSSDAFSGFSRGFHEEANREIVEATAHLLNTLIPKFATYLHFCIFAFCILAFCISSAPKNIHFFFIHFSGELNSLMEEAFAKGSLDNFRLTDIVHSKGINCRYLVKNLITPFFLFNLCYFRALFANI